MDAGVEVGAFEKVAANLLSEKCGSTDAKELPKYSLNQCDYREEVVFY